MISEGMKSNSTLTSLNLLGEKEKQKEGQIDRNGEEILTEGKNKKE